MKKLLLLLLLIPNLVMGENQLDTQGILCYSDKGNSVTNLLCEKNTCVEYVVYGYKVKKGRIWKVIYEGSNKILFMHQSSATKKLNRETLRMNDLFYNYTCEVGLKKSDITKHLHEQIAKSKKENKI